MKVPSIVTENLSSPEAPGSGLFAVQVLNDGVQTDLVFTDEVLNIEYSAINRKKESLGDEEFGNHRFGHIVKTHCDGIVYTLHESINFDINREKYLTLIQKAIDDWSNYLGIPISLEKTIQGNLYFHPSTNDLNRNFIYLLPSLTSEGSTLTYFVKGEGDNNDIFLIQKSDVRIKPDVNWNFSLEGDLTQDEVDAFWTILHELGHSLGLEHDQIVTNVEEDPVFYYFHEFDRYNLMYASTIYHSIFDTDATRVNFDNSTCDRAKLGASQLRDISTGIILNEETQITHGVVHLTGDFPEFNIDNLTEEITSTGITIEIHDAQHSPFYYEVRYGNPSTEVIFSGTSQNGIINYSGSMLFGSGNYCFRIMDNVGCIVESCYYLEICSFSVSPNVENSCPNENNGEISLIYDQDFELIFTWDNGPGTNILSNLAPGLYNYTVTDEETLCSINGTEEVLEIIPLSITHQIIPLCFSPEGKIDITVSGGKEPYTYLWSDGSTAEDLTSLTLLGDYCVTVTDACNDSKVECFSISPQLPYIKKVEIYPTYPPNSDEPIYEGEWVNTLADCIAFTGGSQTISDFIYSGLENGLSGLKVVAKANVPLSVLAIQLPGLPGATAQASTEENNTVWTFIFDPNDIAGMAANNMINQQITFFGVDNWGNDLLDLKSMSNNLNDCIKLPSADSECNWLTTPIFGTDLVHVLNRECRDIELTIVPEQGNIKVENLPPQITFLQWTVEGNPVPPENIIGNGFAIINMPLGLEYCVTVKDVSGCQATKCVTMNDCDEDMSELLSTIQNNITSSCSEGNNGSVCLTSDSENIVIEWLSQEGTIYGNCLIGLSPGSYQVKITDILCENSTTVAYTVPSPSITTPIITGTSIEPACPGENNGSICIQSLTGGIGPYSFQWSNGSITNCAGSLGAGTNVQVTITDACGTTNQQSFQINESNTDPAITNIMLSGSCSGGNGAATFEITGGKEPFSIFLTHSDGTEELIDPDGDFVSLTLPSGDYVLEVVDDCNNSSSLNFSIDPLQPTFSILPFPPITHTCDGGNSGAINLIISNPQNLTLDFLWSNGSTTEDISNLSAGNYSVTVSDVEKCEVVGNFTIFNSSIQIDANITSSCNTNGEIEILPPGGFSPISYIWLHDPLNITNTASQLAPGAYTVIVADAHNCQATETFTVNPIEADIETSVSIYNACGNSDNGSIEIQITSGTPPFKFKWAHDPDLSLEIAQNLLAGTYCVTVIDGFGCEKVECHDVNIESGFNINIDNVQHAVEDHTASGEFLIYGAIDISVSGGEAPYSYLWSNGFEVEDPISLTPDIYIVTVTDQTGCQEIATIEILSCANFFAPNLSINPLSIVTPYCNGTGAGSILLTVHASGYVNEPLSFYWEGPDGNFISSEQNLYDLQHQGTYKVILTDNCGFTSTAEYTLDCNCYNVRNFVFILQDKCRNIPLVPSKIKFVQINPSSFPSGGGPPQYFYIEWPAPSNQITTIVMTGLNEYEIVSGPDNMTIPPDSGNEFCVRVTHQGGCAEEYCLYFGNPVPYFDEIEQSMVQLVPDYFDPSWIVTTGCQKCDYCGGPPCEDFSYSIALFNYNQEDPTNPCKGGGTIICPLENSGISYSIPLNSQATEFVDYENGEDLGDGTCRYPCGCYFPVGLAEGADKPIYIQTFKVESCEATPPPPPSEDCTTGIYELNEELCAYDYVCTSTGELIEPGNSLWAQCKSDNGDGTCTVIEYCPQSSIIPPEVLTTTIPCSAIPNMDECSSIPDFNPQNPDSYLLLFNYFNNVFQQDQNSLVKNNESFGSIGKKSIESKLDLFSINIYPNPFTDIINIEIQSNNSTNLIVSLTNMLGSQVYKENFDLEKGNNLLAIRLNKNIPNGIYKLTFIDKLEIKSTNLVVRLSN